MSNEKLVTLKETLKPYQEELTNENLGDPLGILKGLIDLVIAIVEKLIDNPDNNK